MLPSFNDLGLFILRLVRLWLFTQQLLVEGEMSRRGNGSLTSSPQSPTGNERN